MNKQAKIVRTAQALFAQYGLKKVTMDDIAREASVSKATIYKFYENKSDIFREVVELEFTQLLGSIKEAVDRETTVVDKFRAHLLTKMARLQDFANFYRVTHEAWEDFWPHVADVRKQYVRQEQQIVKGILELGNKRGELYVENIELAAYIMVVALKSLEFPWIFKGLDISLTKYVDTMLDMIIEGLRKRQPIVNEPTS